MNAVPIETPDGTFVARFTRHGLASLDFPGRAPAARIKADPEEDPAAESRLEEWISITTEALKTALRGRKPGRLPPLDWTRRTAFQRKIWEALLRTEPGEILSYAEVAREAGHPNAARAAGSACSANWIPILVPCHRILAAHHRIGGYSGGLAWKRRLLTREGIIFREPLFSRIANA